MAAKEVILVTGIDARPRRGNNQWYLNTAEIAYASQEFLDGDNTETDGYLQADETAENAIAVVHLYLKPSLFGFPTMALDATAPDDEDITVVKSNRPTDIWVEGFLENFYMMVSGEALPVSPIKLNKPSISSVSATDNSILLNIVPVPDADTYYVGIKGDIGGVLTAKKVQDNNNLSVSITGLDGGTNYLLMVQARKNSIGYNYSDLFSTNITTSAST